MDMPAPFDGFAYAPPPVSPGAPEPKGMGSQGENNTSPLLALMSDSDAFLRHIAVPRESHLTFEAAGIPFQAHLVPHNEKATIILWGTLGYLPYSVVDEEKRARLITILEGAIGLPRVRIGVDHEMRILVKGTYVVPCPIKPDYFLSPFLNLYAESHRFLRLIGENL